MTDEQEEKGKEPDRTTIHITPQYLAEDLDPTEWIRRMAVIAEQGEQITLLAVHALRHMAPVLIQEGGVLYNLMASIGMTQQILYESARTYLDRQGIVLGSFRDEQVRLVREHLARPDLDPETREQLLAVLAANLEQDRQEREAKGQEEKGEEGKIQVDWEDPDWAKE